ncbi:ROK family protein [Cellulomonas sp. PhB143]|uniref:ROK family protein n=1 Tax=Cellulomonas sp. PhB143 TaxID=2485186 RepID=UPI000FBFD078|nr:ROK family protein [Cellulomonas sp. PhB143]ROS77003.1 putative NBD/HSP70 family sugar kinase [Cellulomonas sp. PhB143]
MAGPIIAGPAVRTGGVGGGCSVGLDVGGTKILGVLLAPDGRVVRTLRRPTVHGPDGVVAGVVEMVRALLEPDGTAPGALTGVGIGVPGLVDPVSGSVQHAVNLGIGDEPFPLAGRVAQALGVAGVRVDNDLNVAALGAAHLLPEADVDLAYLALGTGLAAGVVLNGTLRRGAAGAAGEIGHVPVDPAGPWCACGQRGCLETFASGSAIASRRPSRDGTPAPAQLLADADAGDAGAVAVRDEFFDAVASAVQLLALTYDVERVVIGGGVAALGEPLLAGVRAALAERAGRSAFVASLGITDRVALSPADVPVAAVGAALVGRREVL